MYHNLLYYCTLHPCSTVLHYFHRDKFAKRKKVLRAKKRKRKRDTDKRKDEQRCQIVLRIEGNLE